MPAWKHHWLSIQFPASSLMKANSSQDSSSRTLFSANRKRRGELITDDPTMYLTAIPGDLMVMCLFCWVVGCLALPNCVVFAIWPVLPERRITIHCENLYPRQLVTRGTMVSNMFTSSCSAVLLALVDVKKATKCETQNMQQCL